MNKDVKALRADLNDVAAGHMFTDREIEDFIDFCLCALRDTPEELRPFVRACWGRTDTDEATGETFGLLLWEGSVHVMAEWHDALTHIVSWRSWPVVGIAARSAVVISDSRDMPGNRAAGLDLTMKEGLGSSVDDLVATGMWTLFTHSARLYFYRGTFPQDELDYFENTDADFFDFRLRVGTEADEDEDEDEDAL